MKRSTINLGMVILVGSLAGTVLADGNGFMLKEDASGNYCHEKFPAIKESTLWGKHRELKDSSTGDVVDFYGPCDESPTGADQAREQQQQLSAHRWDRDASSE